MGKTSKSSITADNQQPAPTSATRDEVSLTFSPVETTRSDWGTELLEAWESAFALSLGPR